MITEKNKDLERMLKSSDQVLYRCSSVFPFTLFPDTVIIDRNKVDIVHRRFFFSKSVFTTLIQDIRTVKVSSGPFFATLRIEIMTYEQNPPPVRFLPKEAAFEVRRVAMGLTAARRRGVKLDKMNVKELRETVAKLGAARE